MHKCTAMNEIRVCNVMWARTHQACLYKYVAQMGGGGGGAAHDIYNTSKDFLWNDMLINVCRSMCKCCGY